MSLTSSRIIASLILFIITFAAGFIPVRFLKLWSRRKENRKLTICSQIHLASLSSQPHVQILMQIGGGILFYTVFGHMMPEVKQNFYIYLNDKNDSVLIHDREKEHGLPYVELCFSAGFFAIFLVEELMHAFLPNRHVEDNNEDKIHSTTSRDVIKHNHNDDQVKSGPILISMRVDKSINNDNNSDNTINNTIDDTNNNTKEVVDNNNEYSSDKIYDQIDNKITEPLFVRFMHGFVLIVAFSVCSIFDGLSIGLQQTEPRIWTMFFAISAHKLIVAFVICMQLYEKCANTILVSFHMTLFSIMSPIGIILVVIGEQSFTDEDNEINPSVILLTAFSAGTLLYIVFFEILQKDRCNSISGLVQFGSIVFGFGIMFIITEVFNDH